MHRLQTMLPNRPASLPPPCVPSAGMSPAQCDNMTNKWHIFMTRDGRLSLAGLSKAKCAYLAQAMDDSIRNH